MLIVCSKITLQSSSPARSAGRHSRALYFVLPASLTRILHSRTTTVHHNRSRGASSTTCEDKQVQVVNVSHLWKRARGFPTLDGARAHTFGSSRLARQAIQNTLHIRTLISLLATYWSFSIKVLTVCPSHEIDSFCPISKPG
jgi:hypothetical protein